MRSFWLCGGWGMGLQWIRLVKHIPCLLNQRGNLCPPGSKVSLQHNFVRRYLLQLSSGYTIVLGFFASQHTFLKLNARLAQELGDG